MGKFIFISFFIKLSTVLIIPASIMVEEPVTTTLYLTKPMLI